MSEALDPPVQQALPDDALRGGRDTDALAGLARRERFVEALAASLADGRFDRLVLAKPRAGAGDWLRVSARRVELRGVVCLQLLHHHRTRDLTENLPIDEAVAALAGWLGEPFTHAHLFTRDEELQLLISKRGKVALHRARVVAPGPDDDADKGGDAAAPGQGHARVKKRWLALDSPFLQALGVADGAGQLVPAMARKWKQINKFVEVLDHALDEAGLLPSDDRPVQVVDFGAGKGYLTFATHQHLSQGRGWPTRTLGIELRPELVALGNQVAQRCGMAGLVFQCGDVREVTPERVDVMIALHACDTATDHALHAGIRAGAAVILSSPCCHKQIRPQISLPSPLRPMLRHGIHLGQEAEMLTDSLRALLLESQGYDAQVFEFVSLEHTSKNKMILAVRRRQPLPAARRAELLAQIAEIKAFYGIREHCLETLLKAAPTA